MKMAVASGLGISVILLSVAAFSVSLSEEVRENERPTLTFGSGPFCQASAADCARFEMEYVREESTGCWTGAKVLCRARAPEVLPAEPTSAERLQVIAYNIFEMIYFGGGNTGQKERTCRLPYRLVAQHPAADAFIFTEAFMGGCVPNTASLRDLLTLHGFRYHTHTVGDGQYSDAKDRRNCGMEHEKESIANRLQIVNGGAFIASRWPIVQEDSKVFVNYHSAEVDRFARKGVVFAKINKTVDGVQKLYNLMGTHMQAWPGEEQDEIRRKQALEIKELLASCDVPSTEPALLGGDLNVDSNNHPSHVAEVMSSAILNAAVPRRAETDTLNITYTTPLATALPSPDKWLDYVVTFNDYRRPSEQATMKSMPMQAGQEFAVCWREGAYDFGYIPANTTGCGTTSRMVRDLSDHFLLEANFHFSD